MEKMGKRLLMIVNPCSGKRKGFKALPKLHALFEDAGFLVTDYLTRSRADATRAAIEMANDFDVIVGVGGDGTLNEVVSGVLSAENRPLVGYIPSGTTNDFARSLGIPRKISRAARAIVDGGEIPFDIGRFADRRFCYIASFGAFVKSAYSAPQRLKNLLGHTAYILRGIADVATINHPHHIRLECDEMKVEGDFIFGAISNSTSFAGLLKLRRSVVDFNDGRFEVMLIRPMKTPHQISECLRAIATKNYYENDQILFFHTGRLRVFSDPAMPWTLDGEFASGSEMIEISCERGAIRLAVRDPDAFSLKEATKASDADSACF